MLHIMLHVSRLDNIPTLYLPPNNTLADAEQNGDDDDVVTVKHMVHHHPRYLEFVLDPDLVNNNVPSEEFALF